MNAAPKPHATTITQERKEPAVGRMLDRLPVREAANAERMAPEQPARFVLSPSDLCDLTGYKTGKKQREWLRKFLGFEPPAGPDGRPRITAEAVNQAYITRLPGGARPTTNTTQPRWKHGA